MPDNTPPVSADRPLKKVLRKEVLDARAALHAGTRSARSREIERRLFSLPEFRAARCVLFYASFRTEVETHEMIRSALAQGKRVVLPRVEDQALALFEIADFDKDVMPGAWGIPEPKGGTRLSRKEIDLIVVPGAAFDVSGNRLGYGAGFYDKLLAGFRGATAALAFELQIMPAIPCAPHDVPMQKIVTEKRVITAQRAWKHGA